MSIKLINDSCLNQKVDAIVNAANKHLLAGGGICGAIYKQAGYDELNKSCEKYNTPLNDGDAVITPAFNITNAKYIIHAVGPDFNKSTSNIQNLFKAYYNSLIVLKDNNLHSISFPLISSGIFGGNLENPVETSTRECLNAYNTFINTFKDYNIEVILCAYTKEEYQKSLILFP